MIGKDDAKRRWSIGELAQATGVTVRTLHHYDEMGLLRPSERTAAGHRRYTAEDLRRLYRVRALRALGDPPGADQGRAGSLVGGSGGDAITEIISKVVMNSSGPGIDPVSSRCSSARTCWMSC